MYEVDDAVVYNLMNLIKNEGGNKEKSDEGDIEFTGSSSFRDIKKGFFKYIKCILSPYKEF